MDIQLSRREVVKRLVAVSTGISALTPFLVGCMGNDRQQDMMEPMSGGMPDWMMSNSSMADMMAAMPVIHTLLVNHEQIERHVEDIPDGIRSTTTSEDAEIAQAIRTHVSQMKERVEQGHPIRQMDPLFREIFEHYQQIEMHIEEISDGMRVLETSDDPQVQLLIRQHAHRAVSEFVADGMRRAMQPTPLPEGYDETE